jgi:GNAT superfamily N-acetyltransferase
MRVMRESVTSRPLIRFATPNDISAIVRVVNAAFEVESPFISGTRTDLERLAAQMQKGKFLVADDEGRIVASAYVELRGERAYLGMLAVDPARQGSGLGRWITESVENYCRSQGCRFVDISVLSVRAELLPMYRKLEFVETGTEEFKPSRDLMPGVECYKIVMTKAL